MKKMLLFFVMVQLDFGCINTTQQNDTKLNIIDSLQQSYLSRYKYSFPNDMQRDSFRDGYLDSVREYLRSNDHIIGNTRVKVTRIENLVRGDTKNFYVEYESAYGNTYFTEFDIPKEDDTTLYKLPAYKLLKDMPQDTDTTISFYWMGGLEWSGLEYNNLNVEVYPFKKDFDFSKFKGISKKASME